MFFRKYAIKNVIKYLIFIYKYNIINMHFKSALTNGDAPLAQLDRALDYGSNG